MPSKVFDVLQSFEIENPTFQAYKYEKENSTEGVAIYTVTGTRRLSDSDTSITTIITISDNQETVTSSSQENSLKIAA